MKSTFLLTLLIVGCLSINSFTFFNDWTVNYSIADGRISFEVTGVNPGYVALGVGGEKMENLDIASFTYVDSKIQAQDRSYINPVKPGVVAEDTSLGGTNDITLDSSSTYNETTGAWCIKFSRPLAASDNQDVEIVDGKPINFAFALGSSQTWSRHSKVKYLEATFSSAALEPISTSNTAFSSAIIALTHGSVFVVLVSMFL